MSHSYTQIACMKVENRTDNVPRMQKVLTDYGCLISARLGLHKTQPECENEGLIIFTMESRDKAMNQNCVNDLNAIDGITVKTVEFD
ncbi:hypothetical protein P9112_004373 [Eukaryota sp. TZLM1-RC]